jgi:hypothetical protein
MTYSRYSRRSQRTNTNDCSCSGNTNGFADILDALGNPDQALITTSVTVDPKSIVYLGLAVVGAGLIIKNFKF